MTTEPAVDVDVARMRRAMLKADYSPTIPEIEYYLDHHMLWGLMSRGNYWLLRRNGRTQRWKRDAARFRIPVKAGLRETGEITEDSVIGVTRGVYLRFLISEGDPNPAKNRRTG